MTLLSSVKSAARRCGLTPPMLVMGSGDETWLQFVEWAQEVVDDLAERHDWRALHKTETLTGDGSTTSFALPADYARLSKMPAVSRDGSVSGYWPTGPLSPPDWIGSTTLPVTATRPVYQIEGGNLSFYPAPASGEEFTLSYQSSKPIYSIGSGSPTYLDTWAYDNDALLIPERLLVLGLVSRWKISKGFDASKFEDDYERALERLASTDWGLKPVNLAYDDIPDEFGEPRVTP